MHPRPIFAIAIGLGAIFPTVGSADPVPGLIRALTELHAAYQTFSTVKGAVDEAQRKIKPSTDFSGATTKYQLAESDIVAIQFPPTPTPPNAPSVAPVTSCPARASAISYLSSRIAGIRASLATIESETSQLNDAMKEIQQTTDTVVEIEKAIPTIAAIPIWGDSTAANVFSMTKKVRESIGNAETPIKRRVYRNGVASQALASSLTTWTNVLNQARQFSTAPTPPGSYVLSCNSCTHDCEQLACNCRRINGSFVHSSINYPSCRSIENADGNLRCGP